MEVGEAGFGEVKEEGWLLRGNGVRGGRVVELRCAGSLKTFPAGKDVKAKALERKSVVLVYLVHARG